MTDQEKEVIVNIVKALREIYNVVTTGVHGYNFTKRVYEAVINAEKALEKITERN